MRKLWAFYKKWSCTITALSILLLSLDFSKPYPSMALFCIVIVCAYVFDAAVVYNIWREREK